MILRGESKSTLPNLDDQQVIIVLPVPISISGHLNDTNAVRQSRAQKFSGNNNVEMVILTIKIAERKGPKSN